MMGDMASHEYRGTHVVHDRAEKAEKDFSEAQAFIATRKKYWRAAGFDDVATELTLILVKMHDLKIS